MLSTLLIALVITAPPQSTHGSAPAATAQVAVENDKPAHARPTVQELRATVTETLRREALAKDATERRQATVDLIALAAEVRNHPKLDNRVGKSILGRIQSRLRRVAEKIKRDLARRDARQRRRPANVQLPDQGDDVLAQFAGGVGGNQNGFNQPGDGGNKLLELIEQTIAPARPW